MRYLTTGDVARLYSKPLWLVREIVDGLGLDMPRAGGYRLIAPSLLPKIEEELRRRNQLVEEVAAHA